MQPSRKSEDRGAPLDFSVLLALAAVGSVLLLFLSAFLVVDGDVFHEMALAREIMEQGRVPSEDVFSYTPTVSPSVHHEWGTGMVLYAVSSVSGASGLLALKYLLGFAVLTIAIAAARLGEAGWEVICFLALPAIILADIGFTTVRAQFFTMLFLALLLVALQQDHRGRRWWFFPWLVVHVIWLNMHAGFVVGMILLGCCAVERWVERRRAPWHLVGVLAAMGALVLINPYGLDYVRYLSVSLFMERPQILEWQPIWASPSHLPIFVLSILLLVFAGATRERGAKLRGWVALGVFALAATLHVRHLSLYAVVWLAFAPAWLDAAPLGALLREIWSRRRRVVAAVAVLVVAGALTGVVSKEPWKLRIPTEPADREAGSPVLYPAGAVDYLQEVAFEGNLMTPFVEGSFVLWKLHPKVKVGLDGRYEVAYRKGVTEEILAFYAGKPGWQATLRRYPTHAVLVRESDPVRRLLEKQPGWKTVYSDGAFEIHAPADTVLPERHSKGLRIQGTFP